MCFAYCCSQLWLIVVSVLTLVDAAFDAGREDYTPYKLPGPNLSPFNLSLYIRHEATRERHHFHRNIHPELAVAIMIRSHSRQSVFHPSVLPSQLALGRHGVSISDVSALDPYWIGYYWIGFGWIGSVLLHYWMDWIDDRRSSWIQYPRWVDDHVMIAQYYRGGVCHDCIYPVTTVCS